MKLDDTYVGPRLCIRITLIVCLLTGISNLYIYLKINTNRLVCYLLVID